MSRIFGKNSSTTRFFNKVGSGATRVLGKVSSGLSTVSHVAQTLAGNPLLAAVAGPEANVLASVVAGAAKSGSDLTNSGGYRGNVNQVSGQVLQKAQNLQSTVTSPPIQYH